MFSRPSLFAAFIYVTVALQSVAAYQLLISDTDEVRQVCSGMWAKGGKQDPFIEGNAPALAPRAPTSAHPLECAVIFSPSSRGQLALVIFEWEDAKYLGVDPSGSSTENAWSDDRIYICTLAALDASLCSEADLGRFITTPSTLPEGNSIFTASVRFNPVPGASENPADVAAGTGPYQYPVNRTGYYCVGTVPVTLASATSSFTGVVDFENVFAGHLPASEWPKINFYLSLSAIYLLFGIVWAALCVRNRRQLLAIQHYITGTTVFLIVEMLVIYSYYNYLNNSGHPAVAKVLLVTVSVLNAARNSLSFFMLLITSMGYGVVKPSLGPVMAKVRLLTAVHFVFGILYSVGTISVPLEKAGFFIFFFVFPLAFTLTAFLMWIMWSLNATIADLSSRKQSYKKSMFTTLYRILLLAVIIIHAFFIISSISFSARLSENYGANTWQTRWLLLDGWLGLLYLAVFISVAWLWRPTENNRRLALSDELPTDEMEAEEYELARGEGDRDEGDEGENMGGSGRARRGPGSDSVVFDVGEDEEDEDEEEDEENGIGMEGKEGKRLLKTGTEGEYKDGQDVPPPSYDKRND